jgi:hypothetical protein
MQEVKIRTSANHNLWPELWGTEWHSTSMKMAETSSSGPKRARASGGPLELVSAIFGPIVFGPFEYSAQTDKIHHSAQSDSALSNSAQRSTTINVDQSNDILLSISVLSRATNFQLLTF